MAILKKYAIIGIALTIACSSAFARDPDEVRAEIQQHIDVYQQLKSEGIEQKYATMLSEHKANSSAVVVTFTDISSIWASIAQSSNDSSITENINTTGAEFIAAVEAASEKTTNKNMNFVAEKAMPTQSALQRAYDRAKNWPEVQDQVDNIDLSTGRFFRASEKYTKYWVDSFKTIADKRQVVDIVREKVSDAVRLEFDPLQAKLSVLKGDKQTAIGKENQLLQELSSLGNTDADKQRRREIANELDQIDTSIFDEEIEYVEDSMAEYAEMLDSMDL